MTQSSTQVSTTKTSLIYQIARLQEENQSKMQDHLQVIKAHYQDVKEENQFTFADNILTFLTGGLYGIGKLLSDWFEEKEIKNEQKKVEKDGINDRKNMYKALKVLREIDRGTNLTGSKLEEKLGKMNQYLIEIPGYDSEIRKKVSEQVNELIIKPHAENRLESLSQKKTSFWSKITNNSQSQDEKLMEAAKFASRKGVQVAQEKLEKLEIHSLCKQIAGNWDKLVYNMNGHTFRGSFGEVASDTQKLANNINEHLQKLSKKEGKIPQEFQKVQDICHKIGKPQSDTEKDNSTDEQSKQDITKDDLKAITKEMEKYKKPLEKYKKPLAEMLKKDDEKDNKCGISISSTKDNSFVESSICKSTSQSLAIKQ